jgi:hypothetical protein
LRIIIERDPALRVEEVELFKSVMTRRRPKFRAFFGSLAVHVAMLALIVAVSRYLSWYHEDDVDWSRFHAEPLRLHLAEPIFFNAGAADVPGVGTHPDRAGKSAIGAKLHSAVPDGLQLPSVRSSFRDSSPIILQPDPEPRAPKPPAALPALAFWARQAPELPRPRALEVVSPGRTESPSPAPKPAGPPVLAAPNREAAITDVNIAMPQKPAQTPPALPVPNSATVPVLIRAVTDPRTASFETVSGQPVNIIALAAERSNARDVAIPKGFQNLPSSPAGDGERSGSERGDRPASEAVGTAREGAAKAPGSPSRQPVGATNQTDAQPSVASVLTLQPGMPPQPPGVPEVIRVQHPSNGSFDVVIMQSAVRDDTPDLAGMLTGNTIYTVYLNVGDRKEWLMEYCVAARDNKQSSPYQINVDDEGTLTPPYPISSSIPGGLGTLRTAKAMVLRGLLTAAGSLQVTKATDTNSPWMSQLVALVSQWQFRPALRNNKAIDVEVVLVIPPHS